MENVKQLKNQPKKLIIEPTTRCNFKCEMCVKQSKGCEILEGDMEERIFSKCEPLFPHLSSVIFTGIGEPLLHTRLEDYISRAYKMMPKDSVRGFQTNGKLLTTQRAVSLFEAGLNKISISVDTVRPELFDTVREGGRLSDVDQAFESLNQARSIFSDRKIEIGIEFVVMKKNIAELPLIVDWAHQRQVDFIMVSHLTTYETPEEPQTAYLKNSYESLNLFESYREKARLQGLDIMDYERVPWVVRKSQEDKQIINLVAEMKEKAMADDLYLNLYHLMAEPEGEYEQIRQWFNQARQKAEDYGISLTLPEIRPRTKRRCPFVEEDAMFVTWEGQVSPCYFLWHKYTIKRRGSVKHVSPVFFNNVQTVDPRYIWESDEYTSFRNKVVQYDYPNCHAWCDARCDYTLDDPFEQDCYINDIPCCDCHWSLGFLNCLY